MNLKDIKPEEFASAIALSHDQPERFLHLQSEAADEVPLIEYLMKVHMHTVESRAPTPSIEINKATLSILTALYLLEKSAENPEIQD